MLSLSSEKAREERIGLLKMKEYLISMNYAKEEELIEIEKNAKNKVLEAKNIAWKKYLDPILGPNIFHIFLRQSRSCQN